MKTINKNLGEHISCKLFFDNNVQQYWFDHYVNLP